MASALSHVCAFTRGTASLPRIATDPRSITFLHEPSAFYASLLSSIDRATRRIVLMSLYLGTGDHERALVDRLDAALGRHASLDVHVVLDYHRGSRSGEGGASSIGLLGPLQQRHGARRVRVSLYHTPHLNGLAKQVLPRRFNEIPGLFHAKVYAMDDDVVVSGANLSDQYFVNRQDRYAVLAGVPRLAEYVGDLADTVGTFSYSLKGTSTIEPPSIGAEPHNKTALFVERAQRAMGEFLTRQASKAGSTLEDSSSSSSSSTFVVPLVQDASLGICLDEQVTTNVLSAAASADAAGDVHIASAYFNMTRQYTDVMLDSASSPPPSGKRFHVLTASPEANGFFNSRGVSYWVPSGYTFLERSFLRRVADRRLEGAIKVNEYVRPGWTFHGKGMWFYPTGGPLPVMTLVGSPNFGQRSVHRDFETQLLIVTTDKDLQQRMDAERANLFKGAKPQTYASLVADPARRLKWWVPGVASIIQPFF